MSHSDSPPDALASSRLPTLDGWRAVAIVGVVLCHATDAVFGEGGLWPSPAAYSATRLGALGVDVFFGLSGFLITSRLLADRDKTGELGLGRFYARRAFRILPAYLLYLTAVAALAMGGLVRLETADLAACLTFTRNYLHPTESGSWYTGHFWSLAIEEHFYLLWPALLALSGPRRARLWVIPLALAIAAWRAIEFRKGWVAMSLPGVGFFERTDTRLDALLWGCALALLLRGANATRLFRGVLTPPLWVACLTAFALSAVFHPPLSLLWQSALIPLLIAGTLLRPASAAARFLELPAIRWLGRISYSLYLWQQLFLLPRHELAVAPFGLLQTFPFNLIAALAAATLSYYVIESRMIRLGHAVTSSPEMQNVGQRS